MRMISDKHLRILAKQVCKGHKHAMRYQNMLSACFDMGKLVIAEIERQSKANEGLKKLSENPQSKTIEIGKTYNSLGKNKGTVTRFVAQLGMFEVKYEGGETEMVNSKGLAVLRDNINCNEFDLLISDETKGGENAS